MAVGEVIKKFTQHIIYLCPLVHIPDKIIISYSFNFINVYSTREVS